MTANPEAAQAASFPVLALLVFASSAFVPLDTMPGWLQAFAEHQPVTVAVNAVRALVLGGPTAADVVAGARVDASASSPCSRRSRSRRYRRSA